MGKTTADHTHVNTLYLRNEAVFLVIALPLKSTVKRNYLLVWEHQLAQCNHWHKAVHDSSSVIDSQLVSGDFVLNRWEITTSIMKVELHYGVMRNVLKDDITGCHLSSHHICQRWWVGGISQQVGSSVAYCLRYPGQHCPRVDKNSQWRRDHLSSPEGS